MERFISALSNTLISFFVAIDIFAVLPVYLTLTEDMSVSERNSVLRQSVLTAFLVGIVFMIVGEFIFRVLGITEDDFKVAGGLVLLVFAVLDITRQERRHLPQSDTTGVVPIGVPLIVGPAVLTTILVLLDHYGSMPTIVGFVANLIVVWFALKWAEKIVLVLGKKGIIALSKIMALLLASIAVMMIRLGLEGIIRGD